MRLALCFLLVAHLAVGQAPESPKYKKIHGISWVASNEVPDKEVIKSVEVTGANWLSLMPFAFAKPTEPTIHFDHPRQWKGETSEGIARCIRNAHEMGYSVAVKPQVWLLNGTYTGDWAFDMESDWQIAERTYKEYVLTFARVAETEGAEMFIIGTELDSFVHARATFWHELIKDVKAVYSGELTYAANWDSYSHFPFWNELDYIGIDAYFPISESEAPTAEEVRMAWLEQYESINGFSLRHDRPILFTEYGYRSVAGGLIKPWESHKGSQYDIATQCNGYIGLYRAVWQQPSFAGGFLWKWFDRPEEVGGHGHTGFTPQNKPSLEVIRDYFKDAQSE